MNQPTEIKNSPIKWAGFIILFIVPIVLIVIAKQTGVWA